MTAEAQSPLRLVADSSLRRLNDGRVLLGGSPLRVLRLTKGGARLVDAWLGGRPVAPRHEHRRLAGRLVRAGMAHPVFGDARLTPADMTVVVPVRDHADALKGLLAAVTEVAAVVVVDDGSITPVAEATVRHPVAKGPAAARNEGWRYAKTDLVAFLDADVVPEPGWLGPLLRHFEDPTVVAVAPRVRSMPGRSMLARYERVRSPLDLGPMAAGVCSGGRVSYVPSAALIVRTVALRDLGGFDERLRFGEDVDLVWRLMHRGDQVRYEPESVVFHAPRTRWGAWLRQRFEYGTSAAPLAQRHGTAVSPVRMSMWSALVWTAVLAGRTGTGLVVAGVTAGLLRRKLGRVGVPTKEALRLATSGHLGAGRLLADTAGRTWWPLAVPLLMLSRRGRCGLALVVGRHLVEWWRDRPPLDPVCWLAARVADDAAYGAGVWSGAIAHRAIQALLPTLSDRPRGEEQESREKRSLS